MRASFLIVTALLAGCGGSEFETATTADSGATTDGSGFDSSSTTDSGSSTDTAPSDSGSSSDTGAIDTGSSDAKPDVGMPDAGGTPCGSSTCAPGTTCVRTHTSGGACLSCEGPSGCPSGTHCAGGCCIADTVSYVYACKTTPSGCTTLACGGACASLCSGGCPCESASSDTVTCHCLAP